MHYKKAMQRLIWRFEDFPIIKVNERDLDAIDSIVDHLNNQGEDTYLANTHFSKLYAYTLGELLKKYNTTIDDPIAHRELHRILDTPFSVIIYHITENMNDFVRENIIEKAGGKRTQHPLQNNEQDTNILLENLENILKDTKTKNYFYKGAWSLLEVEKGLKTQIKNFIINYGINKTKKTKK